MKTQNWEKEFFDILAEVLEAEFPKGEKCQCGKRLPCRSKAFVVLDEIERKIKEFWGE